MSEVVDSVVARGLCKSFVGPRGTPVSVLDNVSLTARAGQITALVGPDGAGKTTFIRMICGLLKADGGNLTVLGLDVAKEPQAVQDRISYMPQRFGLYEDLSVQENLDLYADLHGVPEAQRRERFGRLMEMTDLGAFTGRPAGKLSGGMKQKLGLACTLVRSPDLLLLDEPSVGVDPLSRRDLWKIIEQLVQRDNLSVLLTTAYMDEAERCSRVFVLHEGKLLAEGTPDELRKRARGLTFTVEPPAGVPARELQARLLDAKQVIIDAVPKGGAVRFIRQPDASDADIESLLRDAKPKSREEDLEDAFMMLLRAHHDQGAGDTVEIRHDSPKVDLPSAAEDSGPVIVVRDLVRKFGDFTAVAKTSFDVKRGEIFGLLGPNGAGKTTTFRMLCGLLVPTSGHLEVAGLDLRTARARARGRVGYVAQKFALYGDLSVRENLEFFGGAYGLRGAALATRVEESLREFGLEPEARSGQMPGGFKQRLAMAAALLHHPDILFLDEPTSGIDPLARRMFWRTITELAKGGVTIIVTTHFMEEAEYCDRIAILDVGRVLALGTPKEVREQAGAGHAGDMNSAFIGIVEQARTRAIAEKAA